MAHFAEINSDNIVVRVLVIPDSEEENGHNYLANTLGLGGTWLKTSYNTKAGKHFKKGESFRKNYASVGYIYDSARDAFIEPKPYASWSLDEETCTWNPPVPYPTDTTKKYRWNESIITWEEVT